MRLSLLQTVRRSPDQPPAAVRRQQQALPTDPPSGRTGSTWDKASSKVDTLAGSIAVLLVITVLQRLVGFGRGVLFCRWLDPGQLGQWDLAYSFLMLATPVAVLSLPSAFGRYVEHYRARGQLRTFLARMITVVAGLAAAAAVVIWMARGWFAQFVFGHYQHAGLIAAVAIALPLLIGYSVLTQLFTALRLQRVSSGLQMFHSVVFVLAGAGLVLAWRAAAASVIAGYLIACLATCLAGCLFLTPRWRNMPGPTRSGPLTGLWMRVVPFAFTVWLTDWLANLFAVADRYMIVHYSGRAADEALAMVGQYHTARLFPVIFMQVSGLLAAVLVPYLSRDWEKGQRTEVSTRLNTTLKLLAVALTGAAAVALLAAPLLFGLLFQGKYAAGLAVLPVALTFGAYTGLCFVARTYLWCSERVVLASLSFLAGLVANVALNLMWLPRYGLAGAAWATAVGTMVALAAILTLNRRQGMHIQPATLVLCLLPLSLSLGAAAALLALTLSLAAILATDLVFDRHERQQLSEVLHQYRTRAQDYIAAVGMADYFRRPNAKPCSNTSIST